MENQNLSHYSTDKSCSGIDQEDCTVPLKSIHTSITSGQYEKKKLKSLIQQRVKFLFGADALVKEFRYPRKANECNEDITSSKFLPTASTNCEPNSLHQKSADLPVVRHLRPEFRSKLNLRTSNRFLQNLSTGVTPHYPVHLLCSEQKISSKEEPVDNVLANIVSIKGTMNTPNILLNNAENIVGCKYNKKSCETLDRLDSLPQLLDHCQLTLSKTLQVKNQGQCNASRANEDKFDVGIFTPGVLHAQKDGTGINKQFPKMNENKDSEKSTKVSSEEGNGSITPVRNGIYFLSLLDSKQKRLLDLSQRVDKEIAALLTSAVSEDIIGYLRAASGKSRLLTSQKMEQFRELCTKNMCQRPDEEFIVTNADLQGFWDMIMLQVDHIESLFNEIETLRKNNWQQGLAINEASPQDKIIPRSNLKTTRRIKQNERLQSRPSCSTESKDRRQAQRKLLLEMKRKHKIAVDDKTIESDQIEFFVDKVRKS